MNEGIGVVLCACGPNIATALGLETLAAAARAWPGVAWAVIDDLPCSSEGLDKLTALLKGRPVGRLVVAGCSPKEHGRAFGQAMERAGLNPHMLQMANIREHCAWVTPDAEAATAKALAALAAAVARVRMHQPLEPRRLAVCQDMVVVGAGPAGMEAALRLAEAGRRVHLVEREDCIGGRAALLDELFPTMECSTCALERRMDEVLHHPNIRLWLRAEAAEVWGFAGNWRVRISQRPRGVRVDKCIGCGLCLTPCPVALPDAAQLGRRGRRAMHYPAPGVLPAAPAVDWAACLRTRGGDCRLCEAGCPFGAVDLSQPAADEVVSAGAMVLATGLGVNLEGGDRLLSDYEFERLSVPNGPTNGAIATRGGARPGSVLVTACEAPDSLSVRNALKYARVAFERLPGAPIVVALLQRPAFGDEAAALDALLAETRVALRTFPAGAWSFGEDADGAWAEGPGGERLEAGLIVRCRPLPQAEGAADLARRLGLAMEGGRFRPRGSLLDAVEAPIKGLFLAGTAGGARTITGAVQQGAAAAAAALSLASPGGVLTLDPCVAQVDAALCCGCATCVLVCPFKAALRTESGHARVEEALCRGCGTCAAACPTGAMRVRGFTPGELFAEIAGALSGEPQ